MPWWHTDEPNFILPTSRHEVEFIGGPFDGRWESHNHMQPLVYLPVSWDRIEGVEAYEPNDGTIITSIANYVLSSLEGRWVYIFASSRHPKSLPDGGSSSREFG